MNDIFRRAHWRIVLSLALVSCTTASKGDLVLRLDASDLSTLGLSSDMTDGDIAGFPDARPTGLKFVENWSQKYGTTSNPNMFRPLTYVGSPTLSRPTYDPNGLGSGKPSVDFDYIQGDVVLGAGQRLATGLDNFINSADYTIFFVGQNNDEGFNRLQFAFGQDIDFRTGGWGMSVDNRNWEGRIGGYVADPDVAGTVRAAAGTTVVPTVQTFYGASDGTINFASRAPDGTVTVNTQARTEHGLWGGGDFALGDRGGKVLTPAKPFNGKISEIAIFNTQLTPTQSDAIQAYLANKWVGGPALSPSQLSIANGLMQQSAPNGPQNIARYEIYKESSSLPDTAILEPDWVASGVTASNIGGGGGFKSMNQGTFGQSNIGISQHSLYLGNDWGNNNSELTPASGSPFYLEFSVTPAAGKQIDPAALSFALARGEDATQVYNGADSYGVWVDRGSGFTKVGGQVSLGNPPASSTLVPFFFQTLNVDLSAVSPFTSTATFRIYFWHQGALVNADPVIGYSARIDNLRLTGAIQNAGAGGVVGDYNGNGVVDAADYTVWRDHVGQTFALPNRDPAITGAVGSADYASWKSHFGQSGSGSLGSGEVPEPSTWALVSLGTLLLGFGKRRIFRSAAT